MYEFYARHINKICVVFFWVIITLLLVISVINNRLKQEVEKKDVNQLEEMKKIQKGLIWTNFVVVSLYCLFMLIFNVYLLASPLQQLRYRKRKIYIRTFIVFALLALNIGMIYYLNKALDDTTIYNGNNELNKIYIVIPIINIVVIGLLMENLFFMEDTIEFINNVHTVISTGFNSYNPSITRRSPSLSYSQSYEDLPNRYSPQW